MGLKGEFRKGMGFFSWDAKSRIYVPIGADKKSRKSLPELATREGSMVEVVALLPLTCTEGLETEKRDTHHLGTDSYS